MEPEVLPVFYYNDMLLSNIGDTIGLNLFEPRYLLMCQRLATDPRFLFMPNYEDYRCKPGDVGYVVRITGLWPQVAGKLHISTCGGGRTFGVQGSAVTMAAVSCTWEEPDTNGLHYAQYWPLDPKKAPLLRTESFALASEMLDSGWVETKSSRLHLQKAEVGAEVFFSSNWPDRTYISAFLPSPEAERSLLECWVSALPTLVQPRFTAETFLQAIQRSGRLQQRCVTLDKVMNDLRFLIVSDPPAMNDLTGKDPESFLMNIPKELWAQLLSELQLARIFEMHVSFVKGVRLEPELIKFRYRESADNGEARESKIRSKMAVGVLVTNGFNVETWTRAKDLDVTEDSAAVACKQLNWKLNRLRLTIVQRARQKGQRPLAMLEDDVSRLVCSFVADSE